MKRNKPYEIEDVLSDGTPVTDLYDSTGYFITRKKHSDTTETVCGYDAEGRFIKTESVYDQWGWTEYTYNEEKFLISESRCNIEHEGGRQSRYTYDKNGMLTSKTELDRRNRVIREIVRTPELARTALALRRKSKHGIPGIGILEVHEGNQKKIYNKYGDLCTRVVFSHDGKIIGRSIYDYDTDGRLIFKRVWDKNKKCLRIRYEYDKAGHLAVKRIFDGEKVISKVDFSYSDRGGLLSRVAESYQTKKRGFILDDTLHTIVFRDYDYDEGRLLMSTEQKEQTDRYGKRVSYEQKCSRPNSGRGQ